MRPISTIKAELKEATVAAASAVADRDLLLLELFDVLDATQDGLSVPPAPAAAPSVAPKDKKSQESPERAAPHVVAIAPRYDSEGKRDATHAFQPEAKRFLELHSSPEPTFLFDNRKAPEGRAQEVTAYLSSLYPNEIDLVAFFCHGWPAGAQIGYTNQNVGDLARNLHRVLKRDGRVVLYACSTGEDTDKKTDDSKEPGPGGDGGFADLLRDSLSKMGNNGGWVDAHALVAHTTKNSFVRRFYTDGHDGDIGGDWLVTPRSSLWSKWRSALMDTDLRYMFPMMSVGAIRSALSP